MDPKREKKLEPGGRGNGESKSGKIYYKLFDFDGAKWREHGIALLPFVIVM